MLSPAQMQAKYQDRHIASMEEVSEKHPRLEKEIDKIDLENLSKDSEISPGMYRAQKHNLQLDVEKLQRTFVKDSSDKKVVEEQRKQIDESVKQLVLLREYHTDLIVKDEIDETEQSEVPGARDILESLLADLEKNEASLPKEEKKEEVVVAKIEEKKEEKVEATPPKEDTVCSENHESVLSKQLLDLMSQQNLIMQSMMEMSKAMIQLLSHQPIYGQVSPYGYNSYFAQQQMPQGQLPGLYPDALHDQSSSWNMQRPEAQQQQGFLPIQGPQFLMAPTTPAQSFLFSPNTLGGLSTNGFNLT